MKEQGKELNKIEQNISVFLFHSYDIWQSKRPLSVNATICRGSPWKEAKLEEVLYYHCKLIQRNEERSREFDFATEPESLTHAN